MDMILQDYKNYERDLRKITFKPVDVSDADEFIDLIDGLIIRFFEAEPDSLMEDLGEITLFRSFHHTALTIGPLYIFNTRIWQHVNQKVQINILEGTLETNVTMGLVKFLELINDICDVVGCDHITT